MAYILPNYEKKLITFGASICKIVVIPIGIEVGSFHPLSWKEKHYKRKKLVIPKNAIVIGSFQKDGNGWGEGLTPKLIKGPDIFCDVVEKLSKKYDIFVLLTGPARGYVKKRLEEAKIAYHHSYMEKPNDVSVYFQLCDLYIVTSREEGGPRALMEAMASGVPLISTKVGMAPDIIKNGKNGFLVDIEDTDSIIHKASEIITSIELQKKLIENGLQNVERYGWINIEKKYNDKIYRRLKSKHAYKGLL
jgi:glycosyltransferase involved in cell wall biosynthesis